MRWHSERKLLPLLALPAGARMQTHPAAAQRVAMRMAFAAQRARAHCYAQSAATSCCTAAGLLAAHSGCAVAALAAA